MANSYKFKGVALATTSETALLTAASDETIIIRSIRVTNNTSNTPTISLDVSDNSASTEYTILKTQTLSANTGVELIKVPIVLEASDALKVTIGRDTFNIYYGKGKEIIAIGSKYDKKFKNTNDLVKWLNKEKAKYLGIDDR